MQSLGQSFEEAVEGAFQLVHQPLDLLIGRIPGESFGERFLSRTQLALRHRRLALLDAERRIPEQIDDFLDGPWRAVVDQAVLGRPQGQDRDAVDWKRSCRWPITPSARTTGSRSPGFSTRRFRSAMMARAIG